MSLGGNKGCTENGGEMIKETNHQYLDTVPVTVYKEEANAIVPEATVAHHPLDGLHSLRARWKLALLIFFLNFGRNDQIILKLTGPRQG